MYHILTIKQSTRFNVSVVMIEHNDQCILFDCGPIDSKQVLIDELSRVNKKVEDITHICITHHDHDHIGNLYDLIQINPKIKVISSSIEKAYIEGKLEHFRLTQAKQRQASLPDDKKLEGLAFMEMLEKMRPVMVNEIVEDGMVLDVAGGIEVIASPGHLPGHIAYFGKQDKVLIVGDAMIIQDGELQLANPRFSVNMDLAKQSMDKLIKYPYDVLVCYHGGAMTK